MSTAAAVSIDRLVVRYGEREALKGISFDVERGAIFGLLGPNGGGKTTLFRVLCTLLRADEGTARIFGVDVAADPLAVRRRIGVVFQNQSLDRRLSVEENLSCQGNLYGLTGAELSSRSDRALEITELSDRRRDRVEELSGGLRQRVELAKALLHQPDLLLLDEPSTGVDPGVRMQLWEYLTRLRAELGTTILLTTHLLDEADRCDRLAILDRRSIVASGLPDELKRSIGRDVVELRSSDPEAVAETLRSQFSVEPSVVNGTVRVEAERGPEAAARLLLSLPEGVESVTVSRPTLEDVFIQATGRRFAESDVEALPLA